MHTRKRDTEETHVCFGLKDEVTGCEARPPSCAEDLWHLVLTSAGAPHPSLKRVPPGFPVSFRASVPTHCSHQDPEWGQPLSTFLHPLLKTYHQIPLPNLSLLP